MKSLRVGGETMLGLTLKKQRKRAVAISRSRLARFHLLMRLLLWGLDDRMFIKACADVRPIRSLWVKNTRRSWGVLRKIQGIAGSKLSSCLKQKKPLRTGASYV
ncbi:hypothetical protein A9Q80_03285 [Cycloclasticus sp. 46_83_sub15_T18]|nr:hypothetical protein A9Q80_03285 [Cycloclasticus sp. 46_83_sub15_T18]